MLSLTFFSIIPNRKHFGRVIPAALASALSVSGCASIEGQQAPINMSDAIDNSACPTEGDITAWESGSDSRPAKDLLYRSKLIDRCVDAIDLKYTEFVRDLRRESASVTLGGDLVSQGLSTGAALSGGDAAKALSAVSAGVAGLSATINKDLYYQKTLPAIVSAMNANRTTILKRIRESERDDPGYTPSRARHDLREYALAGSIDVAITKMTEGASAAENASMDALQDVFQASAIDQETSLKGSEFAAYVRALVAARDLTKLNLVAGVVGVPAAKEPQKLGNAIRKKFYRLVHADAAKAPEVLKELMKKLREVLPNEKFGASND